VPPETKPEADSYLIKIFDIKSFNFKGLYRMEGGLSRGELII
jgi:hypothetical protein